MLNFDEVRLYNLALRIVFKYIKDDIDLIKKNQLSEKELKEDFKFGKKDFALINYNYENEYFHYFEEAKSYIFAMKLIDIYMSYKSNYKSSISEKEINDFKEKFLEFKEYIFDRKGNEEYKKLIAPLLELAPKLHWHYLPIYSDNIVYNRGAIPEKQPDIFYDHYHTLEDLYEVIIGSPYKLESNLGDINLDEEIAITIYSNRWQSEDTYIVKRTLNGWDTDFFGGVEGDKEGSAFIQCLEHDSISYPSNIGYKFEALWNRADTTEMSTEELKNNLQKIADWVIVTEAFSNIMEFDKSNYNSEVKSELFSKIKKYFPIDTEECF